MSPGRVLDKKLRGRELFWEREHGIFHFAAGAFDWPAKNGLGIGKSRLAERLCKPYSQLWLNKHSKWHIR
jgi:hypothetical protein